VTEGRLRIGFEEGTDKLYFWVEDNGEGIADEQLAEMNARLNAEDDGETTGLINIHRRLRLKFGDRGGLEMMRGELGGMKVRIYIPNDIGKGE
jgi:two-component system sensor histidine kinase YesM